MSTIIAIEGNIGVGKSTFTRILQTYYNNSTIVSEPIDIWMNIKNKSGENILGLFYKDIPRWAYSFQNLAYLTRMIKIQDAVLTKSPLIFLDRSLGTDKNVFEKMLYDDNKLTDIEHEMYNIWCDFYYKYVNNFQQRYIYLRCKPETAYQRIQKRGRDEEKNITQDYLEKLHKYHEEWLLRLDLDNVIVIDCDRDFENDDNYKKIIIEEINTKFNLSNHK